MHHTVWKLSALAGVVGLGLLIVLQAHRGINKPEEEGAGNSPVTANVANPDPNAQDVFGIQAEPPVSTDPFDQTVPVPASHKTHAPHGKIVEDDLLGAPEPTPHRAHLHSPAMEQEPIVQREPLPLSSPAVVEEDLMPRRHAAELPLEAPALAGNRGPQLGSLPVEEAIPAIEEPLRSVKSEEDDLLLGGRTRRPAGAPRHPLEEDTEPAPIIERPAPPRTLAMLPEEPLPVEQPLPVERAQPAETPLPIETPSTPVAPNPIRLESVQDEPRIEIRHEPHHNPRPAPPATFAREFEAPAERRAPQGTQKPQLSIDKIAPPNATVGSPLVYHILVRNVGIVPAHQVIVEDSVPRGVQLKGTIPQAELDGARLLWNLGTIEPAREKKISVRIVPLGEGVVGSVATVKFSADVASQTNVSAPKLHFDMVAPQQATLNAPIVFNFKISNSGRGDANNVIIRDLLPAGMKHPDGDDLEYEIGTIPAGRSKEVQLTAIASQPGRTINRAVVTADGDISVEAQAQLEVLGPSLTVTRTGPKKLFLNKQGAFRNTVNNTGANVVANVTVVETVPAGLEFASATAGGQFDSSRRTVTWKIDRLDPGQWRNLDIVLTSSGRGTHVSAVRATDSNGFSGEAMGTTGVSGVAALALTISELPPSVDLGEKIKCQVRIVNRGSDDANGVRIMAVVPHGMTIVSAKGPTGYRHEADQLQFDPLPRLAPRGEATIELTLQARHAGESRVQAVVQSDQMSQPLRAEEGTVVVTSAE